MWAPVVKVTYTDTGCFSTRVLLGPCILSFLRNAINPHQVQFQFKVCNLPSILRVSQCTFAAHFISYYRCHLCGHGTASQCISSWPATAAVAENVYLKVWMSSCVLQEFTRIEKQPEITLTSHVC